MAPGHTEAVAERSQDDMPNGDARPHSRHRLSLAQLSGIRASLDTRLDTTARLPTRDSVCPTRFALSTTGRDAAPGLLAAVAVQEATRMGGTGPISTLLRSDFAQSTAGHTPFGERTDSFVPATEEPFLLKSTRTPAAVLRAREARHMADRRLIATPKER